MFALGTLVRPDEFRPLRDRPWWVVLGVATQILVMPAAAWLVTQIVPMADELAAGVILVGCVPGAMASNVLTSTAGGSVAYSVSLTTVATLLSPISVPTVLWIVAGQSAEHSLTKSAIQLAVLVVLPTIAGYLIVTTIGSPAQTGESIQFTRGIGRIVVDHRHGGRRQP